MPRLEGVNKIKNESENQDTETDNKNNKIENFNRVDDDEVAEEEEVENVEEVEEIHSRAKQMRPGLVELHERGGRGSASLLQHQHSAPKQHRNDSTRRSSWWRMAQNVLWQHTIKHGQ